MAAYVIADSRVSDPDNYATYAAGVPETLAPYGGEFVVRGGNPAKLEGSWEARRIIVLRFEDRDHAERWWSSPEYQALVAMRAGWAEVTSILVDGFEPAP
jgi:uncharacterized protein (DUF1330 family)